MDDKQVQELLEDTHATLERISESLSSIQHALEILVSPPRPLPNPRNAATNPTPYRSGRWWVQDGTFPAGATGITPGPEPGPTHAIATARNVRSTGKRPD